MSLIIVFLIAAIVAVLLMRRLGFGSVLGYLAAGMVIGPWGFNLAGDVQAILHIGEFGVVLLLFVIGLELQPSRLWVLRRSVFGMGTAQVVVTGFVLAGIALAWGRGLNATLIAGFGLALSSTALVLQLLAERHQLTTHHGRAAFAVLLFQDLAVVPLLVAVPLLAGAADMTGADLGWASLQALAAVSGLVLGGHYVLRHLLRRIAVLGTQETFTAAALLVVIGSAALMEQVGLSMALGAFLAGILLADSEFRHELEANIEPFKGLLLGLFFIAVGMSANLGLLGEQPVWVLGGAAALMAVKGAILYGLGRWFRLGAAARPLAFVLAQGGEFAFVLFGAAAGTGLMERPLADALILVVTLSMIATPFLVLFNEVVLDRLLRTAPARRFDTIDERESPVIIAGFGRFGQSTGRILRVRGIAFTALDSDPDQVDLVRRFGNKAYYGDASRLDLLRAAGADKARIFVLAIDDVEASLRIAELVCRHFPNLKLIARARNRHHAYRLMDVGVHVLVREVFLSSLEVARAVLAGLGEGEANAARIVDTFRAHDERTLARQQAVYHDEHRLIESAKEAVQQLEELLETDPEIDADER